MVEAFACCASAGLLAFGLLVLAWGSGVFDDS